MVPVKGPHPPLEPQVTEILLDPVITEAARDGFANLGQGVAVADGVNVAVGVKVGVGVRVLVGVGVGGI